MSWIADAWSKVTGKNVAPVPKRLWTSGKKSNPNRLELWENPGGTRVWKVHRLFAPKCDRCLERNYINLIWTVPFKDGVEPVGTIHPEPWAYRCCRCHDVKEFMPQLAESEWYSFRR